MTWYWNYGITVTGVPEGREATVAEACGQVLPMRQRRTGMGWVRGEGGEALSTETEPGEVAVELAEVARRAAGCAVPVRVVFESCESADDEGNSLDDTPLKEFFFAGKGTDAAADSSDDSIGLDGAGHRYVELDMSDNEQIRVTYVPDQQWAGGSTLRIQKRAHTGRVSPGPELPVTKAGELIAAIQTLTGALR